MENPRSDTNQAELSVGKEGGIQFWTGRSGGSGTCSPGSPAAASAGAAGC